MKKNLSKAERSRLGNTNLKSFFAHLNHLVEHPEAIDRIPDGSTVVFQNTGNQWVDQQNMEIAKSLQESGKKIVTPRLRIPSQKGVRRYSGIILRDISGSKGWITSPIQNFVVRIPLTKTGVVQTPDTSLPWTAHTRSRWHLSEEGIKRLKALSNNESRQTKI